MKVTLKGFLAYACLWIRVKGLFSRSRLLLELDLETKEINEETKIAFQTSDALTPRILKTTKVLAYCVLSQELEISKANIE